MDFQKKDWQFNDIITEGELNRMEDGIEEGVTKAEQAQQVAEQAQQTAESHASRHAAGGPDEITPEMIGAETPAGAQAKADAALQAAKDWANAENVTTIPYRAANVPGSDYPVGVTAFEVSNGIADGWIVNQGTVLNIRLDHSYRFTQIFTHSTTGGLDTTYIRTWRSDSGWSDFKKIPMEHLPNTFTENQTIENSDYRYWGVRRGNNGVEIAVSQNGYAQLVKRDAGNIVESINIRGAGDARVGSDRIWHEGNLSSPARTNVDNDFTITQTFNTPNVTGNWTVIRMKRDQNGVGDYGLSMRNDGGLSIWDYINERTLILFRDNRVAIGTGVALDVFGNAFTSSATPTGSGNGYFRNTYIHNADPSGGRNGDVYYKY